MRSTDIEKGAMRRTTCCEFLGTFLRGMRDGSKSGGKYLLRTATSFNTILYQYFDGLSTFSFSHVEGGGVAGW